MKSGERMKVDENGMCTLSEEDRSYHSNYDPEPDKIIRVWISPGLIYQEAPALVTMLPTVTKKDIIEELSKIEEDQTILDYFKIKFKEAQT